MSAVDLVAVEPTELFAGPADHPRQVVRVTLLRREPSSHAVSVVIVGGAEGTADVPPGIGRVIVEVPVRTAGEPGETVDARVELRIGDAVPIRRAVRIEVAEPGWTVHLVPHFHFDPVWWNTQAASVSEWAERQWSGAPQLTFQKSAMEVLADHLRQAEVDPDYCFVVAEVDYLKPFRDRRPEQRALLDRLIGEGRVEVVGGTWNEPDSGLPALETLRRSFGYGLAYQRAVLGAAVRTAWNLDVFGHHPQYPALAAEASMSTVMLARGPFHQWGLLRDGPFDEMRAAPRQHRSETWWTAPGGHRLLLHSLPGHYTAGHRLDEADTVEEAGDLVLSWLRLLRPHAATRTVIVPVGTDLAPPVRWVSELPRHWDASYVWPRLVCSTPARAFGQIAEQAAQVSATSGATPLRTLTRDLNPIYTGKDVTYADAKAAQSYVERLACDAETWCALAGTATAARHRADVDRAWRLLVWLAHHDAVTGTCSDQVYLDLVAAWREAHDRAAAALSGALVDLAADRSAGPAAPTGDLHVVVANADAADRGGLVTVSVEPPPEWRGLRCLDPDGVELPCVVEHARMGTDGPTAATVTIAVPAVPGLGYTVLRVVAAPDLPTWRERPGREIGNDRFTLRVDPARGGTVESLVDLAADRELVAVGEVAGDLVLDEEHPTHPGFGEGPWHLLPTGRRWSSADLPADVVRRQVCDLGERLVVVGTLPETAGEQMRHRTTYLLAADGTGPRVTHLLDGQPAEDVLLRVRWPLPVSGSRPVLGIGETVLGRGHGFVDTDAAIHPWTLDSTVHGWLGSSSTARVAVRSDRRRATRAFSAVEIVVPERSPATHVVADRLAAGLLRHGVTATITVDADHRCGDLALDSNLVDLRMALTGPEPHTVVAARTAECGLAVPADGLTWLPPSRPLAQVWRPGAALGVADLPLLVLAADGVDGLDRRVTQLLAALDAGEPVAAAAPVDDLGGGLTGTADLEPYSLALAAPQVRSGVVDASGAIQLNLRRSCTAWPSGQWLDPPRRTLPDGGPFSVQRWTHEVSYQVVAGPGDWRRAGLDRQARHANRPLRAQLVAPTRPRHQRLARLEPADLAVEAVRRRDDGDVVVRVSTPEPAARSFSVDLAEPTGAAWNATFLDEPSGPLDRGPGGWRQRVGPAGAATTLLRPARRPAPPPDPRPAVAPFPRPHFSRWWTQSTGAPPAGGLPVTTHLVRRGPEVDLVVSSDLRRPVEVDVRVDGPGGRLPGSPDRLRVPAGGFVRVPLSLAGVDLLEPASLVATGRPVDPDEAFAPSWDLVHLGGHRTADLLALTEPHDGALMLAPGETGALTAGLRWGGTVPIPFEVGAVSPFGAWSLVPVAVEHGVLAPGETARLRVGVVAPIDATPGRWWALLAVRAADRVLYGPACALVVTA
ncbi:MAG: hypothetical protein QM638_19175 [Nocardioides sp.]|uniref:glycoside hydrolase family 38 N-terminal domain-containing protein n=1 Tax=Nocardioides sp. TaxID=35761 RepID=UPI0039E4B3B9